MHVGTPDVSRFADMLSAIDVAGPARFIYSYVHEDEGDVVSEFLERLREDKAGRLAKYITAFRMVGQSGMARNDKFRWLDDERVPRGVATDQNGHAYTLKGMGEFKNRDHQSRIFMCTGWVPGLFVLLTVFEKKKENALTAEAINPALRARQEMLRRVQQRSSTQQGGWR
jgi:hypothetical protein